MTSPSSTSTVPPLEESLHYSVGRGRAHFTEHAHASGRVLPASLVERLLNADDVEAARRDLEEVNAAGPAIYAARQTASRALADKRTALENNALPAKEAEALRAEHREASAALEAQDRAAVRTLKAYHRVMWAEAVDVKRLALEATAAADSRLVDLVAEVRALVDDRERSATLAGVPRARVEGAAQGRRHWHYVSGLGMSAAGNALDVLGKVAAEFPRDTVAELLDAEAADAPYIEEVSR